MSDSWSKYVYSSNVSRIAYEPSTQEMVVAFTSGRSYAYEGVPEDVALRLTVAASVGTMLNQEVKGVYPFRKL